MAAAPEPAAASVTDRVLEIAGRVQGVGFRPFVARLALQLGVRGWVRNNPRGVQVRIAGSTRTLEEFATRVQAEAPPAARIASVAVTAAAAQGGLPELPGRDFLILGSDAAVARRLVAVTPDLALCADCRRELGTPGDRRQGYPFINCTQCGPRYSIVEALPYDRSRTTMAAFTMCPSCAREYAEPGDRRYHAEPNACATCGPQVALRDRSGRTVAAGPSAIAAAAAALRTGRIVAVKGLGGFHLMADATNEEVVRELRRRKHREEKPLAVMFPSLAALRAAAEVSDDDARRLVSAEAPIVLLRRRPDSPLAPAIAPDNPCVGALLPYAPLHVLLLAAVGGPLVATSGNLAEEPLCTDDVEARARLGGIADLFLGHDRGIARPVDDSVIRPARGGVVILRRARGFAPTPFRLPDSALDALGAGPLLCVGGHLKSTIAVTVGANLVVSPHIGDLGNPISVAAFRRAVELLGDLHEARFTRVACDAHPDYASTRFAESLRLPLVRVQHHLAHILACLLEHDGGPDRVLGVAWDGTGYGTDGTIWGGEFIVVDRIARRARRVAHLRPFRLPGGDAAIREPRRSALGLLHAGAKEPAIDFEETAATLGFRTEQTPILRRMLARGLNAPRTSSAGRLFDGVAALLGVRQRCSFEGQAAMELEFAASTAPIDVRPWPMPIEPSGAGEPLQLDWTPLVRAILREYRTGDRSLLAARFHATLAAGITAVARQVGLSTVVLSGGCFQNVRLLDTTTVALRDAGIEVLRHHELPPNDGGLAAGQALAALWGITSVTSGAASVASPGSSTSAGH